MDFDHRYTDITDYHFWGALVWSIVFIIAAIVLHETGVI